MVFLLKLFIGETVFCTSPYRFAIERFHCDDNTKLMGKSGEVFRFGELDEEQYVTDKHWDLTFANSN